jgi:hypothetical protein
MVMARTRCPGRPSFRTLFLTCRGAVRRQKTIVELYVLTWHNFTIRHALIERFLAKLKILLLKHKIENGK